MTFYPLIRFVDAPNLDANVRFDFNPHGFKSQDFTLGDLEFLGDPDAIAPELDTRTVSFTAHFMGEHTTQHELMSSLSRELMRPRNWLLFQMSPWTAPVWLHTYSSAPNALNFEAITVGEDGDEQWYQQPLEIDADPDLWGEEITWEPLTVTNDPTDPVGPDGAGGCFLRLPDVKGDLPAPLKVRIDVPEATEVSRSLLTVTGMDATDTYTPLVTGNLSGDVSSPTVNAAYSAGQYVDTTGTTDGLLSTAVTIPEAGPGSYRVFIRGSASATSTWSINAEAAGFTRYAMDSPRTVEPSTTEIRWFDAGVVRIPGASLALVDDSTTVRVRYTRASGTGFLRLDDLFLLIPVQGDGYDSVTAIMSRKTSPHPTPGKPAALVLDGESDPSSLTSLVEISSAWETWPASMAGSAAVAFPGRQNVAHMLLNLDDSIVSDSLATACTLTISLHPRYLSLPGN